MARPIKKSLDYFPVDVDFLKDIKVRKILKSCGGSAPTILICLLGYIYGNEGYFMLWDEDVRFLVADDVGASEALVDEVRKKAIKVGFFDEKLFDKYQVLTSRGIQNRYRTAARQKRNNEICEKLNLLDKNESYSGVSSADNLVNHADNTQSKVNKSKVNKSKINNNINKNVTQHDTNFLPIQELSGYYQQNIGVIRPTILEDMRAYLDDFTEQGTSGSEAAKIIELAIKTSVDNNKPSWGYASACLKNWVNQSLFTVDAIKAALEQHKTNRQAQNSNYSRQPQVEAVTDWDKKQAKVVDPKELAKLQEEWKKYKDEESNKK